MSKTWRIELTPRILKQLKKLDKPVAQRIVDQLEKLEISEYPQEHCKALIGNYSGLWRYRVGSYRVILDIDQGALVLLALEVGHRSSIYR
ncbi:type II toxin-antitoxin system RelE family toxin [Rothia sp. P5764]|uniref:type II toxin-antitoxin system RelE family toxin n=1 Tax=Rothia sp. P5764 TaxID=3402654 RepID=UPI003AD3427E